MPSIIYNKIGQIILQIFHNITDFDSLKLELADNFR